MNCFPTAGQLCALALPAEQARGLRPGLSRSRLIKLAKGQSIQRKQGKKISRQGAKTQRSHLLVVERTSNLIPYCSDLLCALAPWREIRLNSAAPRISSPFHWFRRRWPRDRVDGRLAWSHDPRIVFLARP